MWNTYLMWAIRSDRFLWFSHMNIYEWSWLKSNIPVGKIMDPMIWHLVEILDLCTQIDVLAGGSPCIIVITNASPVWFGLKFNNALYVMLNVNVRYIVIFTVKFDRKTLSSWTIHWYTWWILSGKPNPCQSIHVWQKPRDHRRGHANNNRPRYQWGFAFQ